MTVGLSDSDGRELATLRRRAYGPDAELDAAGERRLRDLEDRALGGRAGDAQAAPDAQAVPVAQAAPVVLVDPRVLDDSAERETPSTPPDATPLRRRVHPVLLAVAALAAGCLLVAFGWALAQPPGDPDARILSPVPLDQERADVVRGTASFVIRRLDPDTLVQYARLGQGTPWSARNTEGVRCLILTVTDDSAEMIARSGVWAVECAPDDLEPLVDWRVDPSYPSPPQELPRGSVVRLTLEDDGVHTSIGRTG